MGVSVDQLHRAVEGQHGGTAVLVAAEPVKEVQAQTLWEDVVHVLELEGHPKATSHLSRARWMTTDGFRHLRRGGAPR